MEEAPHPSLEVIESQKGGTFRRIIDCNDYSQIDFSQPEIDRAIKDAYRVLLKYRARRLAEQSGTK